LRAQETREAAPKLGVIVQSVGVHDLIDFETAFVGIESWQANALLTLVDPFTRQHRKRIVEFAAQRRLPAIYEAREFVEAGGLVSYGPSLLATQRRAAEYIDKIFKAAKPADLPVEQPAKFELLINIKAAKALNLTIPFYKAGEYFFETGNIVHTAQNKQTHRFAYWSWRSFRKIGPPPR